MKRTLLFGIITTLSSVNCNDSNKHKVNCLSSENRIGIFKLSDKYKIFHLKIDNDFDYTDTPPKKIDNFVYLIGCYDKKPDSSTIFLTINNLDTTFRCALYKVDSILFGLSGDRRKFYIRTNYDRYAWVID